MTDVELIESLRDACYLAFDDGTNDFGTAPEAADRIEQLAVTNEALTAELTLMTTERDEAWKRAAHSEKMWGEAEVKLAKAVEALEFYTGYDDDGSIARATLAEISSEAALNKGESHE